MFKTKFEKFTKAVMKWLKKHGVDTEKYLARIMDLITDYFDETDPEWAGQCIKFELTRNFGSAKFGCIREAMEETGIDDFIDAVLDELSDLDHETYYYYNNNREQIMEFADKDADPINTAKLLVKYFSDGKDAESATADEQASNEKFKQSEEYKQYLDDLNPGDAFPYLRELRGSEKYMIQATGSDGKYATPKMPISYAISINDNDAIEKYHDNGVPLKLITGDSTDTETIDFMEQYRDEFVTDFALLTKNYDKNINDALRSMLYYVDDFIISPFDLYNLFVSKHADDEVIYSLIRNMYSDYENRMDEKISYFDVSYKDLWYFVKATF